MNHPAYDHPAPARPAPVLAELPLFAAPAETEAEASREHAIERSFLNADNTWLQVAYAALIACARRFPEFTADDVWDELKGTITDTHNPSAIGPLFRVARAKQLIEKTGRMRFTNQTQRHRELTVWKSLIHDQRGAA